MTVLIVIAVIWVVINAACVLCLYRIHSLADRMTESWEQSGV